MSQEPETKPEAKSETYDLNEMLQELFAAAGIVSALGIFRRVDDQILIVDTTRSLSDKAGLEAVLHRTVEVEMDLACLDMRKKKNEKQKAVHSGDPGQPTGEPDPAPRE